MKILFLKKKNLYIFFFFILFFSLIILFIYRNYWHTNVSVFNPIDNSKEYLLDLDKDGFNDLIKVVKNNSKSDIKITTKQNDYFLFENNNISLKETPSFPMKIYIFTTIRNNTPIIISQYEDNTNIFSWNKSYFQNLLSFKGNIFGILNSKNSKSPIYYSFSSSTGISSLESYIILNNELLDIKKTCIFPDVSSVIEFIDLIEKNYEVQDLPNIFYNDILSSNLEILFNLDKEHNTYSFQDAFFYDDSFDKDDNSKSIKWRLSFEQFNMSSSLRKEFIIYLTIIKDEQNNFKISYIGLK